MQNRRIRFAVTGIVAATSLLFGASLLATGRADAKPAGDWPSDPAKRLEIRIERMTKQFDLTPMQQTEIRKIIETERAQRELQRQAVRNQIDAVLTAEQKAKRETMARTRLDRRLKQMTRRLDLTDDQVVKIRAIFDEQRTNPALNRDGMRERISVVLTEKQRAAIRNHPRHSERPVTPGGDGF